MINLIFRILKSIYVIGFCNNSNDKTNLNKYKYLNSWKKYLFYFKRISINNKVFIIRVILYILYNIC